jgi:hypothetical protein
LNNDRRFKWGSTTYRGFALVLYDKGFQHKANQLERSFGSLMYLTTVKQTTSEEDTIVTLSKFSFSFFLISTSLNVHVWWLHVKAFWKTA